MSDIVKLQLAQLEAQVSLLRSDLRDITNESTRDSYVIGRGMDDFFGSSNSILPSAGGGATDFVWNVTGVGLDITVTPGDIELGPDTVIAWGSITGSSTTVSATTGDNTLWIWVNVDISAETAEMLSGTSITALTSDEKKYTYQKRIAKITFVDDTVTSIARYQCGNIAIPRL